jgi:hypothetical protein
MALFIPAWLVFRFACALAEAMLLTTEKEAMCVPP